MGLAKLLIGYMNTLGSGVSSEEGMEDCMCHAERPVRSKEPNQVRVAYQLLLTNWRAGLPCNDSQLLYNDALHRKPHE